MTGAYLSAHDLMFQVRGGAGLGAPPHGIIHSDAQIPGRPSPAAPSSPLLAGFVLLVGPPFLSRFTASCLFLRRAVDVFLFFVRSGKQFCLFSDTACLTSSLPPAAGCRV